MFRAVQVNKKKKSAGEVLFASLDTHKSGL